MTVDYFGANLPTTVEKKKRVALPSRQLIADAIDRAESVYRANWRTLCRLRDDGPKDLVIQSLVDFQGPLATTLWEQSNAIAKVHSAKRELISRKQDFVPRWFGARLRTLNEYIRALENCAAIGKVIGDAYAWLFYLNDRDLLREHFRHPPIKTVPWGLGGAGEVEFIKDAKVVNRHLVLYHGITTFLRIGDISFIDLSRFRVAAIGELKSKKAGASTLEVNLFFKGPGAASLFENKLGGPPKKLGHDLTQDVAERLRRQVKAIDKAFEDRAHAASENLSVNTDGYFDKLSELLRGLQLGSRTATILADDSLFLAGYRLTKTKLSERLLPKKKTGLKRFTTKVAATAPSIMTPDKELNSLHFGSLLYSERGEYALQPGLQPIFWWPVKASLLTPLVFQENSVFVFHNCARLIADLRARGFEAQLNATNGRLLVHRVDGNRKFEVEGTEYFLNLIRKYLLRERTVADMLENTHRIAVNKQFPGNTRINIDFRMHFGSRPN